MKKAAMTLYEWLQSGSFEPFMMTDKNQTLYTVFRVALENGIDALLVQESFSGRFSVSDNRLYHAVYQRSTNIMFDADYVVKTMVEACTGEKPILSEKDFWKLCNQSRKELVEELSQRITKKSDLSVTKCGDRYAQKLKNMKEHYAKDTARHMYLTGKNPRTDFRFSIDDWDTAGDILPNPNCDKGQEYVLSYIAAPAAHVAKTLDTLLAQKDFNEDLLFQLLCNELVIAEYDVLMNDPAHPVHLTKRIMDAMATEPDAQSVNLTILKNDQFFSCKIAPRMLRCDRAHYYQYDITAKDREVFEMLFGLNAVIFPEEIVEITYKKKTLYINEALASQRKE